MPDRLRLQTYFELPSVEKYARYKEYIKEQQEISEYAHSQCLSEESEKKRCRKAQDQLHRCSHGHIPRTVLLGHPSLTCRPFFLPVGVAAFGFANLLADPLFPCS